MTARRKWGPVRWNEYLVYGASQTVDLVGMGRSQLQWIWADRACVEQFFRDDVKLRQRFQGFLSVGHVGLFSVDTRGWVSYAWMTTPQNPVPPHLPPCVRRRSAWIFHCRTLESYRGRGIYKHSLSLLGQHASAAGLDLYIDTQADNLPSRNAIVQVGFSPHGVARVWSLRVPGWKTYNWGHWQTTQAHPSVGECGAMAPSPVSDRLSPGHP